MVRTTEWQRRGGVWVRETDSTALLTPQPPTSFLSDFDYSIAPLAGCPLACADCYVPDLPTVKFRREQLPDGHALKTRAAWGTWAEVRTTAPAVLRRALDRGQLNGARLFMSPVTDVYWPGERHYRLTRELLQVLAEQPVFDWLLISTRSDLVCRDIDLFQQLGDKVEVGISIPTDRADVAAALGRRNPSVDRRFRAAQTLIQAGIPTRIHVSPLQPHTGDFAARLAEAAHWVWVDWHQHVAGLAPLFATHDWHVSTAANAHAFAEQLRSRMGLERVQVGQAHFADRWVGIKIAIRGGGAGDQ